MLTRDEVVFAFTPVPPNTIDEGQKMRMLKIETNFLELATDIIDLVPVSADRTAALRKLLEAKWTCSQAITHVKKETPSGKQKEDQKEPKAEKSDEKASKR